jgi:hypothetical protein
VLHLALHELMEREPSTERASTFSAFQPPRRLKLAIHVG